MYLRNIYLNSFLYFKCILKILIFNVFENSVYGEKFFRKFFRKLEFLFCLVFLFV